MASDTPGPLVEMVELLGMLREIESVQWDMLGECLRIRAKAGPIGRRLAPVNWGLTPEAAAQLHLMLGKVLADKDNAAATMQ